MGLAPYALPIPNRPRAATPDALLRLDALYLVTASSAGFVLNAMGAHLTGIGFGEAHELALLAGLLLWRAAPRRCWHLSAAAVHGLLAAANLAHWTTFGAGAETAAAVTTVIHAAFLLLQLAAAGGRSRG